MKAVIISKNGGPEVLEIKDIKLDNPKSGEVIYPFSCQLTFANEPIVWLAGLN